MFAAAAVAAFLTLCVAGCAAAAPPAARRYRSRLRSRRASPGWGHSSASATNTPGPQDGSNEGGYERVNADRTLLDVIDHPAFEGFGRFLFPTGGGLPNGGKTLRDAGDLLPYHRHVDVATTVDVVNSLIGSVERGQTVFYDIYTDVEKTADPSKEDTGLFFFRARRARPSRSSARAAASPTWAPSTRAFPMRWS